MLRKGTDHNFLLFAASKLCVFLKRMQNLVLGRALFSI